MAKTKVGGLGQGASDGRKKPEPTGKSLSGLVMDDLLTGIDNLRLAKVLVDKHAVQNGIEGTKVEVAFDIQNVEKSDVFEHVVLNRTDEWFFASHLKLSNEEILHVMRSHLR